MSPSDNTPTIRWARAVAPEGQIGVITFDISAAVLPLELPVELFEGGLQILREAMPEGITQFEELPIPEGVDFAHMRAFDGLPKVRIVRAFALNEYRFLTRMDVKPICA